MDSQRWKAVKLAATGGGRLVGEARDVLRSNGRLALRSAIGRTRASLGAHGTITWPRAPLGAGYDVVVLGDGLGALIAADVLTRRSPRSRVAVLAAGLVGEDVPPRPRAVLRTVRDRPDEVPVVARSRDIYEHLVTERGVAARLRAQPALLLARDLAELGRLRVLAATAGGRIASPEEATEIVGHLDASCLAGALVEADVLTADVDDLVWELAARASAAGADIVEQCRLEGLEARPGGWTVVTSRGRARADVVIDATPDGRALVAVGGPPAEQWRRWESVITQHVQPFLRAHLVVDGAEISQTGRGEVVASGHATPYPARQAGGSVEAAAWLARQLVSVAPRAGTLRVVAQTWRADRVAADGLPSVGPTGFDGLFRLGGTGSDPFALQPALGEAVAHLALGEPPPVALEAMAPGRGTGTTGDAPEGPPPAPVAAPAPPPGAAGAAPAGTPEHALPTVAR